VDQEGRERIAFARTWKKKKKEATLSDKKGGKTLHSVLTEKREGKISQQEGEKRRIFPRMGKHHPRFREKAGQRKQCRDNLRRGRKGGTFQGTLSRRVSGGTAGPFTTSAFLLGKKKLCHEGEGDYPNQDGGRGTCRKKKGSLKVRKKKEWASSLSGKEARLTCSYASSCFPGEETFLSQKRPGKRRNAPSKKEGGKEEEDLLQ